MRISPMRVALVLALPVLAIGTAGASSAAPAPAPLRLANPDLTATQLLNRFFGALVTDDAARLGRILSPAWMIQRANGTWATREQYLAAMPDVRQYQITDVMARYAAPALVIRSRAATQEQTAAGMLVTSPLAPRLSTFVWTQGRWRMTTQANFNPPA